MKLCEIGVFPNIKHQTSEAWQFEVAKSDPDLICRHRTFDLYLCLLSHNQTPKHGSPQAQCTYPEPWAKFDSGHIMSYQRHSAQIIPYKTGWWFQPLRKILFNWDDYSQYMGKKMFQTTNQKNIKWPKLAHFSGLGQPVRSKNGQSEIPLCKSWLVTVRTCCHLWQKMANHQIYQLL